MKNITTASGQVVAFRPSAPGASKRAGAETRAPLSPTRFQVLEERLACGPSGFVLHDLYAESHADVPALQGFALGLAAQAAAGRPVVWIIQDALRREAGSPYGPGLNEMGLAPGDFVLVRARDPAALLAAGEEAARAPSVGAVLMAAWGESPLFNLTASRRLAMAARASGVRLFLARAGARATASAADTRWSVGAAPSQTLEGGAPGRPRFRVGLLRHRGGAPPQHWTMEWDREGRSFREQTSIPGHMVSVPADGATATLAALRRRRG
ncbi:MAG: hypothetical protein ACK4RV_03915 [Caulobacter sp.]|jgi:protein ImuA